MIEWGQERERAFIKGENMADVHGESSLTQWNLKKRSVTGHSNYYNEMLKNSRNLFLTVLENGSPRSRHQQNR